MQVLVLMPEIPYPPTGGFEIRNYQLIKGLASNHRVTLLAYGETEPETRASALTRFGIEVRLVPFSRRASKRVIQLASVFSARSYRTTMLYQPAMQRAIDALLKERSFDVVLVESSLLGRFDFGRIPVVLDEHNLEYEIPERAARTERSPVRRGFAYVEQLKLKREEKSFWRRASRSVFTSEREVAIVRKAGVTTTSTVPNGVDLEYFWPANMPPDPESLVFTGRISYRPNADAVTYFVEEVLPLIHEVRPQVTLRVVGMDVPPAVQRLAGPHVQITGAVPDVRPYLRRAAVAIVPIRFGGGTRLKVLEALAMGKAVVSTTIGCEGIDVVPGRHLLVADSAADFGRAILDLLAHPEIATAMGRRGRALVEECYGWPRLSSMLESVLTEAALTRSA
jgi:polysaccharide biosynthesis protein PslH